MNRKSSDETFSSEEAQRRTETALRAAFNTPHKTYEQSKLGKKRGSAKAKPRSPSHQKRNDRG